MHKLCRPFHAGLMIRNNQGLIDTYNRDLNQKRHEAEILGGKQAKTKAKSKKSRKPKATQSIQTDSQQLKFFQE
ncbi:MAG: hypothetical protein Fur006_02760 [Coleofasciculaceae cyanobacterium]